MGGVLWGLVDVALGLVFVLAGLRLFIAILPMGVFLVGWYGTGMAFYHLGDEGGLLQTSLSVLAGLAVGIALAALSYMLWYVGMLILVAATGATIGSGILAVFSAEADRLQFIVALIAAAVAFFIAYEFYVPTWVVMVGTSMFGAIAAVTGAMLALNRIEIDDLQNGPALAAVNHSWFWGLAWAVIAFVGVWVQYLTARNTVLPEGRWTMLQPNAYARVGRRSSQRRS